MDELWDARRKKLESVIIETALNLFEHTGSGAFKLPIKKTEPELFVVAGDAAAIQNLMQTEFDSIPTPPIICEGCGGEINSDYGKCRRCG